MREIQLITYILFLFYVEVKLKSETMKPDKDHGCDFLLGGVCDNFRISFQASASNLNSVNMSDTPKSFTSYLQPDACKYKAEKQKRFFRICSKTVYFDISADFDEKILGNLSFEKNSTYGRTCQKPLINIYSKETPYKRLSGLHLKELRRITRNVYPGQNVERRLDWLSKQKNPEKQLKKFMLSLLKKCHRRLGRDLKKKKKQRRARVAMEKKTFKMESILQMLSQNCVKAQKKLEKSRAHRKRNPAFSSTLPVRQKREDHNAATGVDWVKSAQICKSPLNDDLTLKTLSSNPDIFYWISKNEKSYIQVSLSNTRQQYIRLSLHYSEDSVLTIDLQLYNASILNSLSSENENTSTYSGYESDSSVYNIDWILIVSISTFMVLLFFLLIAFGYKHWNKKSSPTSVSSDSDDQSNSAAYCVSNSDDTVHEMSLLQKNCNETTKPSDVQTHPIDSNTLLSHNNNSPKEKRSSDSRRRNGRAVRNNYLSAHASQQHISAASVFSSRNPLVDKFNQKFNNPYQNRNNKLTSNRQAVSSYPPLVPRPHHAIRSHHAPRFANEAGRVNTPPNRSIISSSNGHLTTFCQGRFNVQSDSTPTQSSTSLNDSFRFSPHTGSDPTFSDNKKFSSLMLTPQRTRTAINRNVDSPPEYSDPPSYYSISLT